MSDPRDPVLHPIAIADLRPTQITVGMREVEAKRKLWRKQGLKAGDFLGKHMMPAILGPNRRRYIIDHHHLARALQDEGVEKVLVNVVADLSALTKPSFWFVLDNRGWTHPFDARGRRLGYADIPRSVADLVDDPYRSLAGELRLAGGYAKDTTPFSEFLWADYLRRKIARKALDGDFDAALRSAMELARGSGASYLPGWCGPTPRE